MIHVLSEFSSHHATEKYYRRVKAGIDYFGNVDAAGN